LLGRGLGVVLELANLGGGLVFGFGSLLDPSLLPFELVLGNEARVEKDQRVAGLVVELDGTGQLR